MNRNEFEIESRKFKKKIIAGILPLSLNDYPGEIASVIFFQGCNLNCFYCHNRELIKEKEGNFDIEYALSFIKMRKNFITAVVLSGGEPLVHWRILPSFIKEIKNIRKDLKIKLDTNGVFLDKLGEMIQSKDISLDKIAIDIKGDQKFYEGSLKNKDFYFHIEKLIDFINNLLDQQINRNRIILRSTIFSPVFNKDFLIYLFSKIKGNVNFYFQSMKNVGEFDKFNKINKWEFYNLINNNFVYKIILEKKFNIFYDLVKIIS
ncbi:MAG: anaerobic ribonucleoside-triphosphate reductase activating protein [Spirochaetes bacterium]|nr:anaerobic ribonucleoside-triphosphate reductase activating protein [Spirochaetota bacterium]